VPKIVAIELVYVKIIASQRWDVFLRHSVYHVDFLSSSYVVFHFWSLLYVHIVGH